MQRYDYYGISIIESADGEYVRHDKAQAVIAAKDAEIQKANYLLTRRERLIKKLGKKVQSAESKCAKMRELLGEIRLSLVRFRCFECGYEHYEPVDSFFCPSCGKHALGSHHFSGPDQSTGARIDAALKEAGVRE